MTITGQRLLTANAIELSDVGVVREGHTILAGISLTVSKGACCAVLGPNGSGKSALVAVLSGYLWPSTGIVRVNGDLYGRVALSDVRRHIGLVEPSRAPRFNDRLSVRQVVATGLFGSIILPLHREISRSQWRRVDSEVKSIGLGAIADRAYGKLSSGEQMKALLARAMVSDARILMLDEPTVGLDIGSRAACVGAMDRLMQRGDPPTMVVVSHHLDELPSAVDQVVLMKAGQVAGQGEPNELLTSANLSQLFDCEIDVFRNNGRFVASVSATGE